MRAIVIRLMQPDDVVDAGNIDIIKLLDRSQNMSDAEVATYKLSNAATTAAGVGAWTWGFLRFAWAFAPLTILILVIASYTGSTSETLRVIAALAILGLLAPVVIWVLNLFRGG